MINLSEPVNIFLLMIILTEPVSCPKGGELMSSGYCYILASTSASWTDANNNCMNNFGGWLANITDTDTKNKVTSLLTTGGVRLV